MRRMCIQLRDRISNPERSGQNSKGRPIKPVHRVHLPGGFWTGVSRIIMKKWLASAVCVGDHGCSSINTA